MIGRFCCFKSTLKIFIKKGNEWQDEPTSHLCVSTNPHLQIQTPPPYKKNKKLESQKNIDTSLWLSMTEKINKKSKSQNISSKDTSPNAKTNIASIYPFALLCL